MRFKYDIAEVVIIDIESWITRFFYKETFYNEPQKPWNLKKMFKKSPASNCLRIAWKYKFFLQVFKSYKFEKF